MNKTITNLCIIHQHPRILLGMKKRKFGAGRWNGYGGKPNPGETIEQTAIREATEESDTVPQTLQLMAILDFYFVPKPEYSQQVIVYLSDKWDGEPKETEEMKPQWFKHNTIPFNKMWPDNMHWLPLVLQGSKVKGEFLFGENDIVLDFNVKTVQSLTVAPATGSR